MVGGTRVVLVVRMSRIMRKRTLCICENKDTDQLRGNHEADQTFVFATGIVFLYLIKISSF